jgi:hypothetical protein
LQGQGAELIRRVPIRAWLILAGVLIFAALVVKHQVFDPEVHHRLPPPTTTISRQEHNRLCKFDPDSCVPDDGSDGFP